MRRAHQLSETLTSCLVRLLVGAYGARGSVPHAQLCDVKRPSKITRPQLTAAFWLRLKELKLKVSTFTALGDRNSMCTWSL